MKSFWKWFLIVVGALLVVGLLISIPRMFMFSGRALPFSPMGSRNFPLAHGFGMMGFGMMFLGWLIPLGLIALLVLAGVAIGKSSKSHPTTSVASATPIEQVPEKHEEKVCSACGRSLQADWMNCPYCGEKI